jgi:transposase-like protein
MRKRAESRRKWEQIVSRYRQAGLSQAAFAAEQKVGMSALRYWIYKLRDEAKAQPKERHVRLIPVEVTGLAARGVEVRVGEVSISLPVGTPAAYVAELASALGGPRC